MVCTGKVPEPLYADEHVVLPAVIPPRKTLLPLPQSRPLYANPMYPPPFQSPPSFQSPRSSFDQDDGVVEFERDPRRKMAVAVPPSEVKIKVQSAIQYSTNNPAAVQSPAMLVSLSIYTFLLLLLIITMK